MRLEQSLLKSFKEEEYEIRVINYHPHQIILDKIEAREKLNHDEYVEDEN